MYIKNRKFTFILLAIFCGVLAACSTNTDVTELVKRKGVVYKKKSQEPFSGIARSYYEREKKFKKMDTEYKSGIIDGIETIWYKTGELKARRKYQKGIQHGETILWYTNGQKKALKTYKHGRKEGRQIDWKKDGSVIRDWIIH